MEKRVVVAVVLTFLVLVLYQYFLTPPPPPTQVRQVTQKTDTSASKPSTAEPVTVKPQVMPAEEKEIRVETALYSAVFTTRGGTLKAYSIKQYKNKTGENVSLLNNPGTKPPLGIGSKDYFELSNTNFAITVPGGGASLNLDSGKPSGSLIFEYNNAGVAVKRTYTFKHDSYAIDIKDEVSGLNDYWITTGTDFGIHDVSDTSVHAGPVVLKDTDRIEFDLKKLDEVHSFRDGLKWIAQEDKYFFASLVPATPVEEAKVWKEKESAVVAFRAKSGTNSFILYAGPKEYDHLKTLGAGLEHIVDFGFFSIIAIPLFWLLKLFYGFIGNYGWAIILLTIIVRIPFIPLVNKSQSSMKKMQEIQPRLAEVREKYKKDPKKMQLEIMEIYKKHKVNPVGGCLPILLQIPVFFALYKILLLAIELRSAPFMLWIKDLSAPDTLFGHIPASIPLIGGFAVGPLPIVMGITMIIQQKMTPTSLDPRQNQIMMIMPVVFTFLFLNFASGLVLYWLMNNIFSIAQQFYANKKLAKQAV
jgi:YidC/Oxa1 family membrane protein insertase